MIAKVEPLTPARSLRGPFDYRLAGALEDVGVGSMLVVPFGRRRLLGVVVDVAAESELPPERLAEPIAALEADVPQSLVALGLWVAREYVSTPARGLALVLPPGTGTGAGRPLRPKRSLRAAITPAGEAALREGVRMGAKQKAALEELAGAPLGAAALARRTGCTHSTLRSLERRGLIRLESAAEAPRRTRVHAVGALARSVSLTADQEAAFAVIDRVSRLLGAIRRRQLPRRSSFTGSRAAARPRCTCARWRRRSSADSRRSCSSPRSRSRRRRPGGSSSASAIRWP